MKGIDSILKKEILNAQEVAAILNYPVQTVRVMIQEGELPGKYVKREGGLKGRYRVFRKDLDEVLSESKKILLLRQEAENRETAHK